MTPASIARTHSRQLLVEGPDDQHTVIQLMAQNGCDWSRPDMRLPYIRSAEGVERAIDDLQLMLKGTYARVGLVVDADTDPAARWESIRGRIEALQIPCPRQLPHEGWIGAQEDRRFGVWVMPDNLHPGMLEDLLTVLIETDDPIWPLACQATEQAQLLGAPFRPVHTAKAQLHTWLAWQKEPGQPYGLAIKAHALSPHAPGAQAFVSWFHRLYLDT